MMKKRVLSLLLALSLLSGCASAAVPTSEETAPAEEISADALVEAASRLLPAHSTQSGKEETVYVIADANGVPRKTVVSAWLKNQNGDDTLTDQTTLTDLTNVKADGSYTPNGDGTITWEADGADVYYQGTTDKPLPVEVSIRYELDGQEVTPEALEGATGHLKITFDYRNKTGKLVEINGKSVTVYQPFTMISGTVLENEKASGITVTNGEVINSGDLSVVLGVALPGLKDSLGLDELEVDGKPLDLTIPESVVVEADVTDFSLMTILTVAANDGLNKLGLDDIDSVDDLRDSMEDLKDATKQLMDGAGDLHDGVKKLSDGTGDLDRGVNDLNEGARQLDEGANDLKRGTETLSAGAATLSKGVSTAFTGSRLLLAQGFEGNGGAVAGAAALAEGAKQLNQAVSGAGGITLTEEQKQTIATSGAQGAAAYAPQFADGLTKALSAEIEIDEETMTALKQQAAAGAAQQVAAQQVGQTVAEAAMQQETVQQLVQTMIPALMGAGYNAEEAQAVAEQSVKALLTTVADTTADTVAKSVGSTVAQQTAAQVAASIAEKVGSEETTQTVSESLAGSLGTLGSGIAVQTADGVVAQINAGMGETFQTLGAATKQLADGSAALAEGVQTLHEKTGELSEGLKALDSGAAQLSAGAGELDSGAAQLKDGTGKLYDGTKQLDDGMVTLLDGVKQLLDGSADLMDGVKEYNEEGIEKLTDLVLNDLDGSWQRLKAVQDYAREYTSFSGSLPDEDCSVRFIFKTDSIG